MSFSEEKRELIKKYMLEKIRNDDSDFPKKTADNFMISPTSVKRYMSECMDKHILVEDKDQKCGYRLVVTEEEWLFEIAGSPEEDEIYYQYIEPVICDISHQAKEVWSYVFMEMMNNAIEHSKGKVVSCKIRRDYLYTEISITDDGIGIFENICEKLSENIEEKANIQQALTELYKGKFTTRPDSHSGEGIFFSSKMMDSFAIWSDSIIFSMNCDDRESFVRSHLIAYYTRLNKIGTMAVMKLANDTFRTAKEVFDMFAPLEEGFVKTLIPVREICQRREPIARSQARRILKRLDEFNEVIFDFEGVKFMGQGFADEVFRVFQNKYPDIKLIPVHAAPEVMRMIKHVTLSGRKADRSSAG